MKRQKRFKLILAVVLLLFMAINNAVLAYNPPPSDGSQFAIFGWNGNSYVLQGHGVGYTCTCGVYNASNSRWRAIYMSAGSVVLQNNASPYECVTRALSQQTGGYYNCIGRPYNETGVGNRQHMWFYDDNRIKQHAENLFMMTDYSAVTPGSTVVFYTVDSSSIPNKAKWVWDNNFPQ